jgi:3-methyladenine DNA glycosylase AlkD
MSDISSIVEAIHSALVESSNPERKEKIASYMKTSSLDFIGVELPDVHRIVKENTKTVPLSSQHSLMKELWAIETFEDRVAAIDVMKTYAKKGPIRQAMEIIDKWIDDADTWGIIDPLCQPCIGILIHRDSAIEDTLRAWRSSDNFWRRRCSVLPFLYICLKAQYRPEYKAKILEAIEPHIGDEEFFVGKAAGWVLREFSKRDPDAARAFIKNHRNEMTKLVLREGSKKLN